MEELLSPEKETKGNATEIEKKVSTASHIAKAVSKMGRYMGAQPDKKICQKYRVIMKLIPTWTIEMHLQNFMKIFCDAYASVVDGTTNVTYERYDDIPDKEEKRKNIFRHLSLSQKRNSINFVCNICITGRTAGRYKIEKLAQLQEQKIFLFPIRLQEDVLTEIGWVVGTGGEVRDAVSVENIISRATGTPVQVASKLIRYRNNENSTTSAHAVLTESSNATALKNRLIYLEWDTITEFGDNVFFVPYEKLKAINK